MTAIDRQAGPGPATDGAPRALVVIPGSVNYFYNTNGRRAAEALEALGLAVEVRGPEGLGDAVGRDLLLVSNVAEVVHAIGREDEALAALRRAAAGAGAAAALSLDSVMTPWFRRTLDLCAAAGIGAVLDLGLWDQRPYLEPEAAARYRFVPDGLTPSERSALPAADDGGPRPIPWAFVGHATPDRIGFVDELIARVDPSGFVYMPPLEPITESGTPHLGPEQFRRVLERSRYHVWCSHHHHFYMEPERFRLPLLAGCVPLKVVLEGVAVPADAPLRELMATRAELPAFFAPGRDRRLYQRLREAYLARPLEAGMARALTGLGVPARPRAAHARSA